jgi:membrane carboxypeptidase/penicillin-binding protein PbpC
MSSLQVVNPPAGGVYLIDPTLRLEFQTLAFRSTASSAEQVEWRVNGRVVGTARGNAPFRWKLAPGSHQVSAVDPSGRSAEATFVVK